MPEKCPQCGAEMEYRLGIHECGSCGYQHDVIGEPEGSPGAHIPVSERAGEYRRRQDSRAGGGGQPWMAPPPPPTDLTRFRLGQTDVPDPTFTRLYPSLPTEKKVVVWLLALPMVLQVILAMVLVGMLQAMERDMPSPDPAEGASMMMMANIAIVLLVIVTIAYIALLWAALFLEYLPLKWCCGGCTTVMVIVALITFLFPTPDGTEELGLGYLSGVAIFSRLLTLALWTWLLSIFYRDLKEQGKL